MSVREKIEYENMVSFVTDDMSVHVEYIEVALFENEVITPIEDDSNSRNETKTNDESDREGIEAGHAKSSSEDVKTHMQ